MSGRRLCFGDIDSFTVQRVDSNAWRLGIESRDDIDRPWVDGAWLNNLPDASVRALAELLLASLERGS